MRSLSPLLKETGTQVDLVLVGYLTGMGRDLMEELGYPVESIYYLPNLRMRFVESTLYPFIGGDTVRRRERPTEGLQPSVNRILPYASPEFAPIAPDVAWRLSLCCLENARDILLALEAEYRFLYARNLTLNRLSEAVILSLRQEVPDKPLKAVRTLLDEEPILTEKELRLTLWMTCLLYTSPSPRD